jgi:outer membrane lipoprotein-sorting protein
MKTARQRVTISIITVLLLRVSTYAIDITTADDLIRTMHDRYNSTWYDTLTFTQKSTTYNPDGTTKVETWYEAALLPGKLRIDIGPPADGRAYLLADGNATLFEKGKDPRSRPLVNLLLVLGFDVYKQSPETTLRVVQSEKIETTKFHEETWRGHQVYVVGAEKGDTQSPQFWIDKDRLLFVRLLQPARANPANTDDIRFVNYQPLAGTWIAARVEIWNGETLIFTEDYSDIKGNPKLDPVLFDPKQFSADRRP